MAPSTLLTSYLLVFLLLTSGEILIQALNLNQIVRNQARSQEEEKAKALKYSRAKGEVQIYQTMAVAAYFFTFVSLSGFGRLEQNLYQKVGPSFFGPIYLIALALILSIPSLPFGLYSQFVVEERFGFNKMTIGGWFIDRLKGLLLLAVLGGGFFSLILWVVRITGDAWWFAATLTIGLCQLLLLYLFPVIISPLFNRFTPLADTATREEIEEMLKRGGYQASEILVMDGSARSAHPNAYFTGVKNSKRIVLFDTLLQKLSRKQVVAVVAHELGHEKLKHTLKTLLFSFLVTGTLFYIAGIALHTAEVYFAFGFAIPSTHALLALLFYVAPPLIAPLAPLFSILSRRFEFQADDFAKRCGVGEELVEALEVLKEASLSNPDPHPLYKFYYYSHPTVEERASSLRSQGG